MRLRLSMSRMRSGAIFASMFALAAALNTGDSHANELKQSGQVYVEQVQVAFIGSGNIGGGTLSYGGKKYGFDIGGLGIGGIGVSKIEALGEVYDLERLSDFEGAYIQGRYGAVAGEKSTGELWLKNEAGVVIRLDAKRKGLALSLGGDAVYIQFD